MSRLGAWCDLVTEAEYRDQLSATALPPSAVTDPLDQFRRGLSFRVQEYAVLTNGTHLTLHDDRGFSSWRSDPAPDTDPCQLLTAAHLETNIRTTLLPGATPTRPTRGPHSPTSSPPPVSPPHPNSSGSFLTTSTSPPDCAPDYNHPRRRLAT